MGKGSSLGHIYTNSSNLRSHFVLVHTCTLTGVHLCFRSGWKEGVLSFFCLWKTWSFEMLLSPCYEERKGPVHTHLLHRNVPSPWELGNSRLNQAAQSKHS